MKILCNADNALCCYLVVCVGFSCGLQKVLDTTGSPAATDHKQSTKQWHSDEGCPDKCRAELRCNYKEYKSPGNSHCSAKKKMSTEDVLLFLIGLCNNNSNNNNNVCSAVLKPFKLGALCVYIILFNLLKPSSFFTYHQGLTFKNSTWCSLCVERFVWISEQTATFTLCIINWLFL